MQGAIAAVLVILGLVNVTSATPMVFGWLAIIAGSILFIFLLAGPYKKPTLNKRKIATGTAGGLAGSDSSSSGFSGGDCGGGGGGCGGGGD